MPKLLLVEGLPKYEKMSEAELIHETFCILKKGCSRRIARHATTIFRQPDTKREFLRLLEEDCRYLHVSAHGKVKRGKAMI